jgi:hypothetical protein
MGLFGKIVKTAVNVAVLPVAVAKDVLTLGGTSTKGEFRPYTTEQLEKIKEEADDNA